MMQVKTGKPVSEPTTSEEGMLLEGKLAAVRATKAYGKSRCSYEYHIQLCIG
jgi:hypothetical protein